MEGLLVLDFKVKSFHYNYDINFIEDATVVLEREVKKNDFIFIDKYLIDLYPSLLSFLTKKNNIVILIIMLFT